MGLGNWVWAFGLCDSVFGSGDYPGFRNMILPPPILKNQVSYKMISEDIYGLVGMITNSYYDSRFRLQLIMIQGTSMDFNILVLVLLGVGLGT